MDALPNAAAQPVALPAAPPRLLPWLSPEGKPCFLVADDGGSHLSQLADEMEAAQLEMGDEILDHARSVLGDTMSPYSEVRYAGIRLAECLSDALRVAESRGMRLPYVPDGDEGEDEEIDESEEIEAGRTGETTGPARASSEDAPHGG